MSEMPGMAKPGLQALPQIEDRITFLYLECCQINRDESAISICEERGVTNIPAAAISVLLLGPGTNVTHRAMELIGDAGVSVMWVGEHGIRYYAGGRPLTHSAHLLEKQAKMFSNEKLHIGVVRKMYELRFPDENASGLTMQQLRGREGSRVRSAYRNAAKRWNIEWNGRDYNPNDFEGGDAVNQALTAGNMCLYGLAHAVIFALGCSPGLGFIHVGHENSFVYDIADLYKAEVVIPLAFEIAAENPDDLPAVMRRRTRDLLVSKHILKRMVHDIRYLLECLPDNNADDVRLWDGTRGTVPNGISYGRRIESL